MVQVHIGGGDPEQCGELPLEADRHVAQSDGLVTGLEQRARHDPDRVREVDDPGVRVGAADALRDVEDHGHRAQRLGEAARAGRLLPDAAALQRPGLVLVACRLSADAELEQYGVRALHPRVQIGGGDDAAGVPLPREDPPGEAAHQLQALRRRVDEHQLLDGQGVPQPGEAVDEFGGVGRPSADHGEFHTCQPFTPVSVTPSTNAFCAKKNTRITGAMTSTVAAMVRFQSVWCMPLNDSRP